MANKTKTIDLSLNKTSPHVKRCITRIDNLFITQLKNSNIAVFSDFAKSIISPDTFLESYFLDRKMYSFLLGDNLDLLDRMFKNAVCTIITDDIDFGINDKKEIKCVGVWDKYTIYNITADVVSFMRTDFSDDLFFTALQYNTISKEDLEKLNVGTYMNFNEYNQNKFYQILMNITNVVVSVIMKLITAKIPKAFLHTNPGSNGLETKIVKEFGTFMKDDFNAGNVLTEPEQVTEVTLRNFVDHFEKPFMIYCTEMLRESGLSANAISLMLNHTRIFVVYDNEGKTYRQVELVYTFTADDITLPDKPRPQVEYCTTIGDLLDMVYVGVDQLSKNRITTFGRTIKKLIISMCSYAETIYVESMKIDQNVSLEDTNKALEGIT